MRKTFITLSILAMAATMFTGCSESTQSATITGFSWERTTNIQECVAVDGSGWELPKNAFDTTSETKQHGERKVVDPGTHLEAVPISITYVKDVSIKPDTDLRKSSDGYVTDVDVDVRLNKTYDTVTFEGVKSVQNYHMEPIMETFYTYKIPKWQQIDTVTKSDKNHEAIWPETEYPSTSDEIIGAKRSTNGSEKYFVTLCDAEEKLQTVSVDYATWSNLQDRQTVTYTGNVSDNHINWSSNT